MRAPRNSVRQLEPSLIRKLANQAMGREDVIPLWFGEPDQPTPDFIRAAAKSALDEGNTFYQPNAGLPLLRQAIYEYMNTLYGTHFALDNVIVTASGMQAVSLAGQCVVEQGDTIVTQSPTWPNLPSVQTILGANVVRVPIRPIDQRWLLDLDELFDTCRQQPTKAILLNSPSNPTGWTLSDTEQMDILNFCREYDIWIIADEVYNRIVYTDGYAPTFADKIHDEDKVLIINSFSKAWAMTGWRLGWLTIPSSLRITFEMLTEYNNSCILASTRFAGVEALRHGEDFIQSSTARYQKARDYLVSRLSGYARVDFPIPDAAFYAFFSVEGVDDSYQFAEEALQQTQVGLAPGIAFGPEGEGFLRLCYAVDTAMLDHAINRLHPMLC